jgi:hypothetical protein
MRHPVYLNEKSLIDSKDLNQTYLLQLRTLDGPRAQLILHSVADATTRIVEQKMASDLL